MPGCRASLKWWMTSRTVSPSAATSQAITGTVFPPAEANSIIARRWRTVLVLPRRTICCSLSPSSSVNLKPVWPQHQPRPNRSRGMKKPQVTASESWG